MTCIWHKMEIYVSFVRELLEVAYLRWVCMILLSLCAADPLFPNFGHNSLLFFLCNFHLIWNLFTSFFSLNHSKTFLLLLQSRKNRHIAWNGRNVESNWPKNVFNNWIFETEIRSYLLAIWLNSTHSINNKPDRI